MMSRSRIVLGVAGVLTIAAITWTGRPPLLAQAATTRAETGDAAVAALVAEIRALRADLAAASRSQLRAQLLLGRVQMQEQRLAYLDKQRADTAAALMAQGQMSSIMRLQGGPPDASACAGMPSPDARRDCEANVTMRRQQFKEQEEREAQLRTAENDLANAVSAEQARWSGFNAQLDELERALR
jgi:hypothetical protein